MSETGEAKNWIEALGREEIADLRKMNDLRSLRSLLTDWGLVFAAMAVVAWWPNVVTVIAALFVIGGRQLGFAILMHEASHRTLFSNRTVNDVVGQWFCAYPVWSDLELYRPYHLQHHAKNWTSEDPDIGLATPFPVTPASLRRKIVRDLTGQTAWKRVRNTIRKTRMAIQFGSNAGRRNLRGVLVTNATLMALLAFCGRPELYLLWVGAWFTTHHLAVRLRSIAEHAVVPDPADPLRNTRTVLARWWERLLLAPNFVNYHLEHHLVMTVPHYNLPRMHRMLRERGVLDHACIEHGYPNVLRLAASKGA